MDISKHLPRVTGVAEYDALTQKQKALVALRLAREDEDAFKARVAAISAEVAELPDITIDTELGGTGLGQKLGLL
jgi:hypothetical protein